jgi:hypothetical protein
MKLAAVSANQASPIGAQGLRKHYAKSSAQKGIEDARTVQQMILGMSMKEPEAQGIRS